MDERQQMLVRDKLRQARESLEDAKALLVHDAEVNFVMNSLYYAFLYPVLGLLQARGSAAPMQATAISLFEREFSGKGGIEARFIEALQKAFKLRPACACEGQQKATPEDVEQLLPLAEEFLKRVEQVISSNAD
ncbi:MAG TPA: HEPN domain-containing protein [Nitrospirota bacterium]|nr:HEPN domain-containing protein [Nitrospirota bacterium]